MRVLSLSTLFPSPQRPAFGKFVASQMEAVAARGDVELVVVNPLGMPPWPLSRREPYAAWNANPAQSERAGITVHHPRFITLPLIGGDSNPARIARTVLPLARRLHAERAFDVIDAQFFFPDGPAAMRIAAALALPFSIKARGSDIHYWGERPKALAQMQAAARASGGMLVVSDSLRGDMAALGMERGKIAVHYTGLDHARFHPQPRAAARAALAGLLGLAAPDGAPLFVCTGALIAIKGQSLAIEALVSVPLAHLALAGSGADEALLRRLAAQHGVADRVHFLGQVPHEALPTLLSAADAMVLPSEREGLANAWIEALACGTPLVIPDIGGAREVVADEDAGRIAARDPQAIAEALNSLLAAAPPTVKVAAHAARFSWEANAAQLVDHWCRLAGR
ncbi:MAG: glycosyltransferase [Sphingomonadales bacterium]|nr:glycosyltransferase [Sphingomonadales bacterium]